MAAAQRDLTAMDTAAPFQQAMGAGKEDDDEADPAAALDRAGW